MSGSTEEPTASGFFIFGAWPPLGLPALAHIYSLFLESGICGVPMKIILIVIMAGMVMTQAVLAALKSHGETAGFDMAAA